MALINPFVKSAWNKLVLICIYVKKIVIKFFVNMVGYVIMVRVS